MLTIWPWTYSSQNCVTDFEPSNDVLSYSHLVHLQSPTCTVLFPGSPHCDLLLPLQFPTRSSSSHLSRRPLWCILHLKSQPSCTKFFQLFLENNFLTSFLSLPTWTESASSSLMEQQRERYAWPRSLFQTTGLSQSLRVYLHLAFGSSWQCSLSNHSSHPIIPSETSNPLSRYWVVLPSLTQVCLCWCFAAAGDTLNLQKSKYHPILSWMGTR